MPVRPRGRVRVDGSFKAVDPAGSWSWPSLAAAVARFDTEIEVVGPAELTDAFGHLARRFARTAVSPTPGGTA